MFEQLEAEICKYNAENGSKHGKAIIQWYEEEFIDSGSESELTPTPK